MRKLSAGFILSVFALSAPYLMAADPAAVAGAERSLEKMTIEVVRQKKTRVEGGDYDDKKDRIVLKLKFTNPDLKTEISGIKAEVFVFADPIVSTVPYKLIQRQEFDLKVGARSTSELLTDEVVTTWDKTGAKFGEKYDGWALLLKDPGGKVLLSKATTPAFLGKLDALQKTVVGNYYDRNMEMKSP